MPWQQQVVYPRGKVVPITLSQVKAYHSKCCVIGLVNNRWQLFAFIGLKIFKAFFVWSLYNAFAPAVHNGALILGGV